MVKIASFYFLVGVVMGMAMSMTSNFSLTPVHVHLNLIGWVSMALGGIVYHLFPAATKRLGKLHFWMHNLGVPFMMGGLAAYTFGAPSFIIAMIPLGGTLIVVGTLLFFINVLRNVKSSQEAFIPSASRQVNQQ